MALWPTPAEAGSLTSITAIIEFSGVSQTGWNAFNMQVGGVAEVRVFALLPADIGTQSGAGAFGTQSHG